jgi:hypothetical protein
VKSQIQTLEMPQPGVAPATTRSATTQRKLSENAVLQFLAVTLQFGLIVLLVGQWDIKGLSVARVMQISFAGFIVHHLLPKRFRLSFFALLSIAATVIILGDLSPAKFRGLMEGNLGVSAFLYQLVPGSALLVIGLSLVGICHIPVAWGIRVAILLVAGGALTLIRANTQWVPDLPTTVWVVLGSMFVFRLMVYMYDLKHNAAPFSASRAISYFFMLPNVCFPLFPLVDYKTFCSTYYNEDWRRVYQSGLRWMFRGAFQLLLYQAIYQFAPLDVATLSSALGVAGFMLSTYLLYLHVSGQFHLIVGLLHMFGFNLPETHHLFLLASSFTDFWRRINIYWKDFIMKLFFYPAFFKLRKLGTMRALTLATIISFFLTWALHSWQWFWIRGSFLHTWQDISFWTVLALLVLVNALYEAAAGGQKKLSKSRITLRERTVMGLKTVGTFLIICTLWTIWSCRSMDELRTLADAATRPTWIEVAIIAGFLLAVGVAGMIWGRSSRDTAEGKTPKTSRGPFPFWRVAGVVTAGVVCLLALPSVASRVFPGGREIIARLQNEVLNARDMNQQRRGYYEELDAGRNDKRQNMKVQEPDGWNAGMGSFYRKRSDFLLAEIVPSASGVISGVPIIANQLGMRDREYQKLKPSGVHRTVLLGSSHEFGAGVRNEETFENLVEDRLNLQPPDARLARWEILNMAASGESVFQKMLRLERVGFEYQPDAALLVVNPFDWNFVVQQLIRCVNGELTPPPDYAVIVDEVVREAGVKKGMPPLMVERRLRPHAPRVYEWIFKRFSDECKRRNVLPLVVYRPAPLDDGSEASERSILLQCAHSAGVEVIDLYPAFQNVENRGELVLARWDDHTSVLGHRLLAEKLHEALQRRFTAGTQ